MRIRIRLMRANAKLPVREEERLDLFYAGENNIIIYPRETKVVPTGLSMILPGDTLGLLFVCPDLPARKGLRLANCTGVITSADRKEISAALYNDSSAVQTIRPGDRIAQIVFIKPEKAEFVQEEDDGKEQTDADQNQIYKRHSSY